MGISKRYLAVLVVVALVLAVIAISLRVLDSGKVSTSGGESQPSAGTGKVGVVILPPTVEDKLANSSGGGKG